MKTSVRPSRSSDPFSTGDLELIRPYLVGDATVDEARHVEDLASRSTGFARELRQREMLLQKMDRVYGNRRLPADFQETAERKLRETSYAEPTEGLETADDELAPAPGFVETLGERFGVAPWWLISGAFHALLLLLITLIGMAILRSNTRDAVIITDLEKKQETEVIEPPKERDVFKNPVPIETEDIQTEEMQIVTHEEVEVADVVETDNDSEANDTLGENGISDVWLGGSGTVAALGLGGGGGGAFGRPNGQGGRMRRAIRGGGSAATESAVDKALEWLARNQEADGRWDNTKHGGTHKGGGIDAGATGLALLAFLGAGHSSKIGKYKDNVRRGVKWLIDNQDDKGEWAKISGKQAYAQGIAALALAEASAMSRIAATREAAQKAINAVDRFQRKSGPSEREAWGYSAKDINDTSVTGWQVMAMKSAKVAGLQVDPATFDGALRWINAGQDLAGAPEGGGASSDYEGGRMAYRGTVANPNKGGGRIAMCAAAAMCRLFIGGDPDHPGVVGPCNIMKKNLPQAKGDDGGNYYYYYYSTYAMFQKGGEHWKAWNEALKTTLVGSQVKGGKDDGSWNPHSRHADNNCRVLSTALGALCLEVYYRYLPLYRE